MFFQQHRRTKMQENANVQKLMELTEDELLVAIGDKVYPRQQLGLGEPQPADLLRAGRIWLEKNSTKLQDAVCGSEKIKNLVDDRDNQEIAVAIGNLIAAIVGVVSPAIVAVLLVKKGISLFCSTRWSNEARHG
jgi:hypothetical protein